MYAPLTWKFVSFAPGLSAQVVISHRPVRVFKRGRYSLLLLTMVDINHLQLITCTVGVVSNISSQCSHIVTVTVSPSV